MLTLLARITRPVRALIKAAIFFLKVFPMLPSRVVDWVTGTPVIERVSYPTSAGQAEGDLYRPAGDGPYPGILVCLGVVPFEVDHPQIPVLGRALARAGFVALFYWSPAMRSFRLNPEDIENIALAYHWLIAQPGVDPARSGLLGTCVGGSFALMAAASPLVRERVAFLCAYAPFSSLWTFARDIAGSTRTLENIREPWKVDPLTRKVFVHSITAWLEPGDADRLRSGFEREPSCQDGRGPEGDEMLSGGNGLSLDSQAVYNLLSAREVNDAEAALRSLPIDLQVHLTGLSPMEYIDDLSVPLIVLLHDTGDLVIPVGESRRLISALSGRGGVHYTEMQFSHLDPVKGKLPFFPLARELGKFFLAIYPLFRQSIDP